MKIEVYMIGKTKDHWILEGMEEYIKRLSPYVLLHVEVLKESKHPMQERCMEEEAVHLHKYINTHGHSVLLDPAGKTYTSEAFAEDLLAPIKQRGGLLQLFIAGPFGLHESDKQQFDGKLSFSPMTFTHQMVRPLLFEQLYRAMTILQGKRYHY